MNNIQFGHFTEEHEDTDGNKVTMAYPIVNGQAIEVRKRYEIRVRVNSDKEELEEYIKFRTQTKDKLKAEFRIEHTAIGNEQGFYYIVKCWTDVI